MRCLGVDLAQKNTGLLCLDVHSWPPAYGAEPMLESHVKCGNTTKERIDASWRMAYLAKSLHVDLVVIEDYTKQSHSFVSFTTGEYSGMLRFQLWMLELTQLWVPPMKVKTFLNYEGTTPIKKKDIRESARVLFGHTSKMKYAKEREDCTDAYVLAMIGIARILLLSEEPEDQMWKDNAQEWLTAKQAEVFYGRKQSPGLFDEQFLLEGNRYG